MAGKREIGKTMQLQFSRDRILYYLALVLFAPCVLLPRSLFCYGDSHSLVFSGLGILILLILVVNRVVFQKHTVHQWGVYILLTAIALGTSLWTGNQLILPAVALVLAAEECSLYETVKVLGIGLAICTLVVMGASCLGVLDNFGYTITLSAGTKVTAHASGFLYYDTLGYLALILTAAFLYVKRDATLLQLLAAVVVNCALFTIHFNESPFALSLALIVGVGIWRLTVQQRVKPLMWRGMDCTLPAVFCGLVGCSILFCNAGVLTYLLAITLLVLTAFAFVVAKQDILSPTFLFLAPFCFSSLVLVINIDRWSVNISLTTYMVVVMGCLAVFLGSICGNLLMDKVESRPEKLRKKEVATQKMEMSADLLLLLLFVIFQIVGTIVCFFAILDVARSYGNTGTVSELIFAYRNLTIYTTESVTLGSLRNWIYHFITASGYIWGYLLALDLLRKKINIRSVLLAICLALSLVACMMKGGRQSAIQIMVCTLIVYLVLYRSAHKTPITIIPVKGAVILGAVCVCVVLGFQSMGELLGRTVKADPMQYLAVYFSGGLRNLDVYLKSDHTTSGIFGKMTIPYVWNYIGSKLKVEDFIYALDLPYQSANGHNSGNIYTTFYAYVYDFGIPWYAIPAYLIGLASQICYRFVQKRNRKKAGGIRMDLILYGYLTYMLLFSFFSNKFYELFFRITFVKYLVIWGILLLLVKYFRVSNIKRVLKKIK